MNRIFGPPREASSPSPSTDRGSAAPARVAPIARRNSLRSIPFSPSGCFESRQDSPLRISVKRVSCPLSEPGPRMLITFPGLRRVISCIGQGTTTSRWYLRKGDVSTLFLSRGWGRRNSLVKKVLTGNSQNATIFPESERNSVGRVLASQASGRGFESHRSLFLVSPRGRDRFALPAIWNPIVESRWTSGFGAEISPQHPLSWYPTRHGKALLFHEQKGNRVV